MVVIDSKAHSRSLAAAAGIVAGAIVLSVAQGGYFPTSWGWASAWFLVVLGAWLVGRPFTEIGRLDLVFIVLLAGLTTWVAISTSWSTAVSQTILEIQRDLVLVTGVAAFLVVARRSHVPRITGALLGGITAISVYALATRLFPDRLGSFDPIAVYRLSDPVGYWNGLGLFAAIGVLLALGLAVDGRGPWGRAAAAACVTPLVVTLYFTFSRGAWIALASAALVVLATSPARLKTLTWASGIALPGAAAVVLASKSEALTRQSTTLAEAVHDGKRLAVVVATLSAAAALVALALHVAERRVRVPHPIRLAAVAAAAALAVGSAVALVDRYGDPIAMARDAWAAFEAPPPELEDDLNQRLFSFSGNGRADLWRAALDVSRDHRLVGSGAGTFERRWQQREDASFKVRDAHGLYVETLAELGPLGLAILVAALAIPVVAGIAARRSRVVPGALGAYVAFVIHAGVDWDWELTGVTTTALLVGCVLLIAARGGGTYRLPPMLRGAVLAAVVLLIVASLGGQLGNSALASSQAATADNDLGRAIQQADRARALMPWSPWPWIARGEALAASGDPRSAAASFRRAIEIDPGEWRAWAELAIVTQGRTSARALERARTLYPRNVELQEIERRRSDAAG